MTGKTIKTGFIGLGSQGGPMARAMVEAGFPLTLWARRPESLQPYQDTKAAIAGSVAELGGACDHVAICVVDDAGVEQICAELIPAMPPGGRIVIHSTIHPTTCIALAAQAAKRGIALIDAPVSGGGQGAASKTLTVMVGGDDDAVAAARPVFETFAGLIVHLGGIGSGQLAKLVNNSLMAAHVALAHQAVEAASALGIDRTAFIELVKVSSGRSYGFEVASRLRTPSDFAHGAKLLAKDVRLFGEALGDRPGFALFDDATRDFLKQALA